MLFAIPSSMPPEFVRNSHTGIFMTQKATSIIDSAAIAAATAWSIIMAMIAIWGVVSQGKQTDELSIHQARSFFQEIVTTRFWNATHGGVYVPVTSQTQPNPYLDDPERDLVTDKGLKLTKINPAYMTRQIAEIAKEKNLVWFHITSDKPIRPANVADQWEAKALKLFLSGSHEFSEFTQNERGVKVFRYMAPLWVEAACLKCHSQQGYKEGDLRGGISVTLAAGPMFDLQKKAVIKLTTAYICIWAVGLIGMFLGYRMLKKEEFRRLEIIAELEDSIGKVKKLSGLLPICSSCKKIRDDKGYWNQLEAYIADHSEAELSHGICPECAKKLYPDLDLYDD
jgi:hypothetical protein